MSKKPRQGAIATIFQWTATTGGLLVWLFSAFQLFSSADRKELLTVGIFCVAVVLISWRPIVITTPGLTLSHKRQLSITLSDSLTFLLLILHGPAAAVLVTGIDGFVASRRTIKRWSSNVFTWAMFSLSVFAAAQVFGFILNLKGIE